MSGIAGFVGGRPRDINALLAPIDYRGDTSDSVAVEGAGLGYRWWAGRPGKSQRIHRAEGGSLVACAGTLAPHVPDPAAELLRRLKEHDLDTLDGAFAAAWWDPSTRTLTLIRDPFGVRSVYYSEHDGTFWFATELKQLLAGVPAAPDLVAIHRYLTFSFVPGEASPIQGIRRLLPGHVLTWRDGVVTTRPYFTLEESIDPALEDQAVAARRVYQRGLRAVEARLNGESEVAVYLSGGLDSSAVAVWLRKLGAPCRLFHLGFTDGVDRESADSVAAHLGAPLEHVPVDAARVAGILDDLVWKLDLPFGDAVTGPQYLLGAAARAGGLTTAFNGEGGDQLFGGWTSKPMVAAALFGGAPTLEEQYLQSYHRFYGREEALYAPAFREAVGDSGKRRALHAPFLEGPGTLLGRVRLTDIALKGSQNILPRAERLANAHGLDVRVPLFDRRLARLSFRIPPRLKLHGAAEKYVLKLAMQAHLPAEVVWRRKFGMSVPITDWLLGPPGGAATPLTAILDECLSPNAVRKRGLFEPAMIERLRAGEDEPTVTRRRRIGEKLWALLMLELWMRRFVGAP